MGIYAISWTAVGRDMAIYLATSILAWFLSLTQVNRIGGDVMDEILSQKEIDALLSVFSEMEGKEEARHEGRKVIPPSEGRRAKAYDFRKPDKFSRDQLRAFQLVMDAFSASFSTSLSAYLRTPIQMEVYSVGQMRYEEFIPTVPDPSSFGIFTIEPLQGNAVIEMNPSITFPMLDRLLGGPGMPITAARPLTDMELTIVSNIFQKALSQMRGTFETILPITPKLLSTERSLQFVQVVPPAEMVVIVSFKIKMGECTGFMSICIPCSTIEPIIFKLKSQFMFSSDRGRSAVEEEVLKEKMSDVPVQVRVILGTASLTVKELMDLEVGDCIRLERRADDELEVKVGKETRFFGRPGIFKGSLAVVITRENEGRGGKG
jgi:flagellar motor switch protein FliM